VATERSWPIAARKALTQLERDTTARRALWLLVPLGVVLLAVAGRQFWFAADDWAFLLTRQRVREVEGWDSMLMTPQDGHWMLWPLLVFRLMHAVFGIGSYWPYLVVLWITHIGAVALVRQWMTRLGVTAWTTTLTTAVLLMFGAGWENLFFAVQIVYNFSLLAFLGQTLLVDHEGPVDRRDAIGAGLGVIGVSSSGFGVFFGFGVGLLLALRRRWRAAVVAVAPQAVALGWWWLTWGDDPAGDAGTAGLRFVVNWTKTGVAGTFTSLTGSSVLSWSAFLLCVAVAVWPRTGSRRRVPVIAMLVTALVMYAGIGLRREQFGIEAAAWPRYQYMAAMLVAPALAIGLDQARRFAPWARWVPRLVLLFALARNVVWMNDRGDVWAARAAADRTLFGLVAGSPERESVPLDRSLSMFSPDVRLVDLPELVADGAITPTPPVTDSERTAVAQALGLAPGG
jgi:hypothetical protein